MRKYRSNDSLVYFARYRWYLKMLNAKRAEYSKILSDIHSGMISRDTLDPFWKERIKADMKYLRGKLRDIEFTADSLPDTPELMPCKLFIRLYFILGLSLSQTAEKMNVSLSTVRRVKERTAEYFDKVTN